MTADRPYPPGTHEQTPAQSVTFATLVQKFVLSEQFAAFKYSTRMTYRQHLTSLLRNATEKGIDTTSVLGFIQDMQQREPESNQGYLYAIRSAVSWGVNQGLIGKEVQDLVKELKHKESSTPNPIRSLDETGLVNLLMAARRNPRDFALIATILITQPTQEELNSLKKESVKTTADGNTEIEIGDEQVKVPQDLAPAVEKYAASLKPKSALFPNPKNKDESKPISRQAIDLILKRYREELDLPSLGQMVLVRTGQLFFTESREFHRYRRPQQRNHIYTPQIPLP